MNVDELINIEDVRHAAKRALPKSLFDFVDGGADDEVTMRQNRVAFEEISLLQRGAAGVSKPNLSKTVLGVPLSMPVILAPCGQIRLFHPGGDIAASKAAADFGVASFVPSGSGHPMEDVAKVTDRGFFQLYKFGGRAGSEALIERAKKAGLRGLVVTVDSPTVGNRERDRRNGYTRGIKVDLRNALRYGPGMALRPAWLYRFLKGGLNFEMANIVGDNQKAVSVGEMQRLLEISPFDWDDIAWIRELWPDAPLVVKGLIIPDDARRAVDRGADAVVVSNHGGRQLDGAPATMRVLADVVEAVGASAEVLVDSGVRRGSDVAKALALGASAVLIGRPYVFGLAAGGERGVERVLTILRAELERALTLMGCDDVTSLDGSWVRR